MSEEEFNGCLGTGESETDYVLQEADIDNLPELYEKDEIRFEWNQGNQERSKQSCTIFSALGCLADLINYGFTLDEIKEYDEESYKPERGRIKGHGRYTKQAFDLVCKKYNASELAKKYGKVAYYRVSKFSDEIIKKLLDKNYTIGGNGCITTEYRADYKKDAYVEGCDFGKQTNGHAFNIINYKGQRSVKDSYVGRKTTDGKKDCNIFGLAHRLDEMTNYGPYFYVFTLVKEDNIEEIKRLNELKACVLNAIENNSKMRHLVNDESFKNKLHDMNEANRKKLEDIQEQLQLLS